MGCPVSITLTFALFTIQVDSQTLTTTTTRCHTLNTGLTDHTCKAFGVSLHPGEHVVMCQSFNTDTLKDPDLYLFGNRHT